MAKANDRVLDLFIEGLNNAAKYENTTGEGGVMFMAREPVNEWNIPWDDDNNSSLKEQVKKNLDVLAKMDPVTEVHYDPEIGDYKEQLYNTLHNKLGMFIEREDGYGSLQFTEKEIKTMAGYVWDDGSAAAAIAAPYVIKRGRIISGHKNHKFGGYPSVTYAAPALLNGKRGNVAVAVKFNPITKGQPKGRVHSLTVLTPDGKTFILLKEDAKSKNGGLETKSDPPQAIASSFEDIIPQSSAKGNTSTQKNQTRGEENLMYKYAVKNGNTERAQRLVDRRANEAFADSKVRDSRGKLRKVYHWTNNDFYTFDNGRSGKNQGQSHGDGIYISTSPDEFSYAGSKRMELYANITNPFEMQLTEDQAKYILDKYAATKHNLDKYDGLYREHAMEKLLSPVRVFDYLKEYAEDNGIKVSDILKDLGYDGVHDGTEWVAYDSGQLKSAEPVTYDDKGNYIPLAERFDTEKGDIRYDARDADYPTAVERGDMDTAQKRADEAAENPLLHCAVKNGMMVAGDAYDHRYTRPYRHDDRL